MNATAPRRWVSWIERAAALAGLGVVAWAAITAWGAIIHGHPAYAILLGVVGAVAVIVLVVAGRRGGGHPVIRTIGAVLGIAVVALTAWLRPFPAGEAAVAALEPDAAVTVVETPTLLILEPVSGASTTGLVFQPGARVDPRAYAAVLRPVAEAGYPVVIVKQPLAIGFLALGAVDQARAAVPDVTGWVVGGHSLGGTVAAIDADAEQDAADAPTVGLLLFASYPASDLSQSLRIPVASISGTQDGLSTPAKINESAELLPADTVFTVLDGVSHAQFGDYGLQPGDGVATVDDSLARAEIAAASLEFLADILP
jgi:pimeloyl-ACP methyl ester carboxylesterase